MSVKLHKSRGCTSAALLLSGLCAQAAAQPTDVKPEPEAGAAAAISPAPAASAPAQQFQSVQIRASREPAQGSLGSVNTLSGREAALVPGAGSDSIKALQSLPGVASSNDGSGEPVVRGSRPSDNAYYIDFLPAGYLFHVGGLISVLPGELVQNFDLHSAAFGPQFADVTGAVLDVTLRRPRNERLGGQIDASLLASGVIVEGPVAEGHSFFAAARRSYLDLLVKDIKDEDSGVVQRLPRYSDYQFKYLWQLGEANQLSLNVNGAFDHLDFSVPDGSTLGRQQPALVGEGRSDASYATQAVQWEADLGRLGSNRLAVGRTVNRVGTVVGDAADLGVRSTTGFVREQLRLKLTDEHELWLGGSAERNQVNLNLDLRDARCTEFEAECDISSADKVLVKETIDIDQYDVYARHRWQFHPGWALTTGLRHSEDRYLRRRHTEPRVGLEWAWSPETTLSAAWGLHNQQPAGEQILAVLGNPQLDHLRARHAMLGIHQTLGAGWSWRAEVYDKALTGLVVADPESNYRNGGSGHAWGAELLLRKDAAERPLSGWLSVGWARSTRRNDATGESFAFEFDQPLIVSLVGRWKLNDAWSFGAKWALHSGSLSTPIVGTRTDTDGRLRPVYGSLNSERLPAYHRLDLRADRRFSDSLTGYAEVINAYNRENVGGYSYSADYSSRKPETQLPMLVSVGMQWRF